MRINTNREVEIFDNAYRLGFQAGQIGWRRYMIAKSMYLLASGAGALIAVKRGNISLEEYSSHGKEKGNETYIRPMEIEATEPDWFCH